MAIVGSSLIIYLVAASAIVIISGCATLSKDFDKPESYALNDTETTVFGKLLSNEKADHPGKSGFHLLPKGLDAFVARAVLAHHAERSIDAQYYLYHNDLVGKLFTDLLLKAASRGVRVRLLVDDMDLAGKGSGGGCYGQSPQRGSAHLQSIQPQCRSNHPACDAPGLCDPADAQ